MGEGLSGTGSMSSSSMGVSVYSWDWSDGWAIVLALDFELVRIFVVVFLLLTRPTHW